MPGGEPTPRDAFPVDFKFNLLAVEVLRSQVLRTPFWTISFLLVFNPSPSKGREPRPFIILGSSIIFISLLKICLLRESFKKLVPLAIELPETADAK